MLKINLLPPQEKEQLKLDKIHRIIILIGSVILVMLIILIIIMSAVWLGLSQIKPLAKIESFDEINNKVKTLNSQMKFIDQTLSKQIIFSELLDQISKIVPSGITLSSLQIKPETKIVNLMAHAQTRDQMLVFQKNLEQSSFLKDLYSPMSNLTKKYDFDFSFVLYLNNEN